MVLPMWLRGGRAVSIPLGRSKSINLPNVPFLPVILILLTLAGIQRFYAPLADHNPYTGRTRSSFVISPYRFIAPPPHDRGPDYFPEPIKPKKSGQVIPNSVHYVYGLKPPKEGEEPGNFPYYAYLAMRSAILRLEPEKVYFHYKYLPQGPWWDMILPHLTLIETESPEWILGKKLGHYAHKADVVRLLAMKYSGGIYLDIDVFVVKPFDDLLYFPTTLAMEESPDQNRDQLDPTGLCNAVIIAEPHAEFIDRWIASYETFDDNAWADHSVNMPWTIARRHPDEVQVLSIKAMFWPMWYGHEIDDVHTKDIWDFYGSGQYTYHAWESLAMGHLWDLNPKKIKEIDTSFNRLVRPLVGPEDEAVYDRLHQPSAE